MHVLIDNSVAEKIDFYFTSDDGWQKRSAPRSGRGEILTALEKVLAGTGRGLTAITGIAVVVGRGTFTATRLAVTIANTLAYALQIPVVAAPSAAAAGVSEKIQAQPIGQYALASYSGAAHLGRSES